jgi:hypothetical protein
MVLCWCFHENCQFFDVCEIPVTGGSLVLVFSQKNWNRGLFDSEIFKELEVLTTLKNQITAQHWFPVALTFDLLLAIYR